MAKQSANTLAQPVYQALGRAIEKLSREDAIAVCEEVSSYAELQCRLKRSEEIMEAEE